MADDKKGTAEETPDIGEDVSEEKADTQPADKADVKEDVGAEVKDQTSKWENEKKSMAGKISKLEKDLNTYKQQAPYLEALNKAAANDPEFMRLANKKLVEQGVLDESALESLPKDKEETGEDPKGGTPPEDAKALEWARYKQQQEVLEQARFFEEFEKDKSDIVVEANPLETQKNRQVIRGIAEKNIASGMDKKVAYEKAYLQYLHPEKLKEEGEMEGLVKAQSTTPAIGGASGQQAKSSGGVNLSDAEKNAAANFGMSEEEYAKFKNPPELDI